MKMGCVGLMGAVRAPAVLVTLLVGTGGGGLLGCSTPVDLAAVEEQRTRSIQRFDHFQALAWNGSVVVAAGSGGTLLTSRDQGESWTREPLPNDASIVALATCPDQRFVALDFYRRVFVGDAAGRTWTAQPLQDDFTPLALTCDPLNRAWVVGSYSTMVRSSPALDRWTAVSSGEDVILTAVQFVDRDHGFVLGEFGSVFSTRDGGESWQTMPALADDFYPYAAYFSDPLTGWVSGLSGAVLHTQDGGLTWQAQANRTETAFYALVPVSGRLLGLGAGGLVGEFTDLGWTAVGRVANTPFLTAGVALGPDRVLAAGGAGSLQPLQLDPPDPRATRQGSLEADARPARAAPAEALGRSGS